MVAVARPSSRAGRLAFPLRTPFVLAAERANELDLKEIDEVEPGEQLAGLGRRTRHVVDDMIAEAAKLSAAYDDASDATAASGKVETRARRALRDIVDLAYITGWMLHRKRASLLDASAAGDEVKLAGECSSARRAVIKSAVALERAIAVATSVRSDLLHLVAADLARGLRTRATYHAFRAALRPEDPPDEATIEPRLRAAFVALARVCDGRHHGDLRLHDRLLFHQRRRDVAAWIRRRKQLGTTNDGSAEGLRHWKDLALFAECLRMVNHRPELRDHDERMARAALESLAWHDDDAALDEAAIAALGPLLGRDDALDELLLARRPVLVGELRGALERLG
jgi:hypothetical protein